MKRNNVSYQKELLLVSHESYLHVSTTVADASQSAKIEA